MTAAFTRRRTSLLLLAALLGLLASCRSVEFWEREAMTDSVMNFDDGPSITHLRQKVIYSMEGSAGGIGSSAGGGCGCY
ncbi:MAG: hypothetical protein ACI8QS_003416 [Planctomycetota bacterium]|jgi:hypothetical protein